MSFEKKWNLFFLSVVLSAGCQGKTSGPGTTLPQPNAATTAAKQPTPTPPALSPTTPCGNGKVDKEESCDDGNVQPGDGCSPRCRIEPSAPIGSYWLLPDQTIRAKNPSQSFHDGRKAVVYSPSAVIVDGPTQHALPASTEVPQQLRGRITQISNEGAMYCALVEGHEIWCVPDVYRPPIKNCSSKWYPFVGDPLLTSEQQPWCKVNVDQGPIRTIVPPYLVTDDGQIYNFQKKATVELGNPAPIETLVGGLLNQCVLTQDGRLGCWGNGWEGALGYMASEIGYEMGEGDTFYQKPPVPVFLKFDSPIRKVSALGPMTFALLENKQLWGWGRLEGMPLEDGIQFPHSATVLHDANGDLKKPGESTLPSAPLKLPDGCTPLDIADEYVLCSPGCWKTWTNEETRKTARCVRISPIVITCFAHHDRSAATRVG